MGCGLVRCEETSHSDAKIVPRENISMKWSQFWWDFDQIKYIEFIDRVTSMFN